MSELLDKAKVIHDEQVKANAISAAQEQERLEKENAAQLLSSKRAQQFVQLMIERNIPIKSFQLKACEIKGWVVRESYAYKDGNRGWKTMPDMVIMEDLTVYECLSIDELQEQPGSGTSFSSDRGLTILCERLVKLGITE